uniref:(northern house mosquito) hypothetical protein n=1 Tax=Culex pipiens TaxID=7175 RepID=A0A8D8BBY0_CULPI
MSRQQFSKCPPIAVDDEVYEIRQCLHSVPEEFFLKAEPVPDEQCLSVTLSTVSSGGVPAVPSYTRLEDLFDFGALSPEVIDKLCFTEMMLISAGGESAEESALVGGLAIQVESIADEVIAVFCSSQFSMGDDKAARSELLALTDKQLSPFQERKSETVQNGDFLQEKQLQLYFDEDQNVTAVRHETIGDKTETCHGVLEGHQEGILIPDGLNVLFMRYLMVTDFTGELHTQTIDITGRVGHSIYQITNAIPTKVNGDIHDIKQVIRTIYYDDTEEPEVSVSHYFTDGHLQSHTWNNSKYYLTMNRVSEMSLDMEDMCTTMQVYLEELARLLEGTPKEVTPARSTDVIRGVLSEIMNAVSYKSISTSRSQLTQGSEATDNVRHVLVEIINQMSLS